MTRNDIKLEGHTLVRYLRNRGWINFGQWDGVETYWRNEENDSVTVPAKFADTRADKLLLSETLRVISSSEHRGAVDVAIDAWLLMRFSLTIRYESSSTYGGSASALPTFRALVLVAYQLIAAMDRLRRSDPNVSRTDKGSTLLRSAFLGPDPLANGSLPIVFPDDEARSGALRRSFEQLAKILGSGVDGLTEATRFSHALRALNQVDFWSVLEGATAELAGTIVLDFNDPTIEDPRRSVPRILIRSRELIIAKQAMERDVAAKTAESVPRKTRLSGLVESLTSEDPSQGGVVKIRLDAGMRLGTRLVKVPLDAANYRIAFQAHREQVEVSAYVVATFKGRQTQVIEVVEFGIAGAL